MNAEIKEIKETKLDTTMEHTLGVLQFAKICEMISTYCVSDEGKEQCKNRKPFTNEEQIEYEKKCGKAFLELINSYNTPPLKYRPPVLPFLDGIEKDGAALDIEGVYSVGLLAKSVCALKDWAEPLNETEKFCDNEIVNFVNKMPAMFELYETVFSFIDENGELQDLPTLRAIKKKINAIERDIDKTMNSYFTNEKTRGMLQSNLPTIKDGRQVISVMSNFKGRIKGIIHEYSQSGQTFYLEPEDIVLKNNDLLLANAEYERELLRLLQELTAKIAKKMKIIKLNCEYLIQLDCISAGAKWAHSKKAVYAKSNSKDIDFYLKQARHPLLGESAVPIDLKLSKEHRVLIITGPNTGGKTVSLKTAALFALINQAGWPVPAEEKTSLPYFDFIACDIGDEQSLDQSLSTFSAHMKTVANIIENANSKSLVVLDELGSGTDPQEGCAIAMAVLDYLLEQQSFVFVTTHHGALKNYGYSKKSCINASVEFNQNTLSPTYKILMGVPGESHAIDIAERKGLQKNIIAKAKEYMGDNRADVSDLIKGLIQKHEDLNEFETQKKEEETKLRESVRKAELKKLQLRQKELELKRIGIKKLDKLFEEKRRSLENLVREIREGELTREKTLSVKKWIDDFEDDLNEERNILKAEQAELDKELQEKNKANSSASQENGKPVFEVGMKVFVKPYNRRGEIVHKEKKDKWLVALDKLKVTVAEKDLEPCENQDKPRLAKPVIIADSSAPTSKPSFELRLLGMRAEEAQKALQDQMDLALVHGISEFAIIHGKGFGVLQKLTQDFLKKSKFVSDYHFAKPEDGGSGKTIVKLG